MWAPGRSTTAGCTRSASAEPTPEPPILMLVNGLDISIIHATTGEIIRELIHNPAVDYQTQGIARPDQGRSGVEVSPMSCDMTRVELMPLYSNLALSALYSFG